MWLVLVKSHCTTSRCQPSQWFHFLIPEETSNQQIMLDSRRTDLSKETVLKIAIFLKEAMISRWSHDLIFCALRVRSKLGFIAFLDVFRLLLGLRFWQLQSLCSKVSSSLFRNLIDKVDKDELRLRLSAYRFRSCLFKLLSWTAFLIASYPKLIKSIE